MVPQQLSFCFVFLLNVGLYKMWKIQRRIQKGFGPNVQSMARSGRLLTGVSWPDCYLALTSLFGGIPNIQFRVQFSGSISLKGLNSLLKVYGLISYKLLQLMISSRFYWKKGGNQDQKKIKQVGQLTNYFGNSIINYAR